MIAASRCFATGSVFGLALFGALAQAWLSLGRSVPDWWLPLALLSGFVLAAWPLWRERLDARCRERLRPDGPPDDDTTRASVGLRAAALTVIILIAAALTYGALATPPREWDGFVAWEARTRFLTASMSVDQDYFTGTGVFSHSRDYPLLQPLSIAAINRLLGGDVGRLVFPWLYLVSVSLLFTTVASRWQRPSLGWLTALGFGVTPILVTPSLGGVDSGYAEMLVQTFVLALAAGLHLSDRRLLFAATVGLVLTKPEGVVYGALAILVSWFRNDRRSLLWSSVGLGVGASLWLPLQHRLNHRDLDRSIDLQVLAAAFVGVAIVLGSDRLLVGRARSFGVRLKLGLVGVPLACLAVPILTVWLGNDRGALGVYLDDPGRPFRRLARLPAIIFSLLDNGLGNGKFLATFVLPTTLAVAWARGAVRRPEPALALLLALGLGCCVAPFLFSPEEDTGHHLRSTMSRLLIHWAGAAWLLSGSWLVDSFDARGPALRRLR